MAIIGTLEVEIGENQQKRINTVLTNYLAVKDEIRSLEEEWLKLAGRQREVKNRLAVLNNLSMKSEKRWNELLVDIKVVGRDSED